MVEPQIQEEQCGFHLVVEQSVTSAVVHGIWLLQMCENREKSPLIFT